MAHAETHGRRASERRWFGSTLTSMATTIAAVREWQRSVARRRAIADLTSDQLKDVGLSGVSKPTLEIKAGLITNLMSMR